MTTVKKRRRYISVDVEVDVNLDELDDQDLIEELRERGYTVLGAGCEEAAQSTIAAERAYYALNDQCPPPIREFILDAAGRVS